MRESSSFFTQRAADVTSEPFSLAMSGDRNEGPKHAQDEIARIRKRKRGGNMQLHVSVMFT